jgi:hypothetical protein
MAHDQKPITEIRTQEAKPSRTDEARRVIEEYADDLREVIKTLRKSLK